MNNFFKKNIKKTSIFILLLLLWAVLTFAYIVTFDTSFSIWSYNHPRENFTKITFNKLNRGDSISGRFIAQDNNLGIVSIRFQTYIRPPYKYEDNFLFRIKQKGTKNWYYRNTYRSGLIYDVPFFPFGFPQIADSKGKEYEFEIISLNGNNVNAISVKNQFPILETKYKYSGSNLIHNKEKLIKFSVLKVYNAFQVPDVWFSSLIYLLPFLFFFFWSTILGQKLLKPIYNKLFVFYIKLKKIPLLNLVFSLSQQVFLSNFDKVILLVVFIDIFIIQLNNDIIYLVIVPLWLVTFKKYRLESKNTFITGVFLLIISSLFLFFKLEPTAEKSAIWAYVFFVAGAIQIFVELKAEKQVYEKS